MSAFSVPYISALQNTAKPNGRVMMGFPLPAQSPIQLAAYSLEQVFEMRVDGNFPPAQKNLPANNAAFNSVAGSTLADANAILTSYTPPQNMGAGVSKFTCKFNRVPASWDDYTENFAFNFAGFHGEIPAARYQETAVVSSRIHYDYYVLDPNGLAAGVVDSGGNAITVVANASLIPVIKKFRSSGVANPTFSDNLLTAAGGTDEGDLFWLETLPNIALYTAWIATAKASGWASTAWNGVATVAGTVGQIVAEDSRNSVLAGNIIQRATRYVLVQ